jgi:hypothetical protein
VKSREALAEKRRAALECERLRVQTEIVSYPMPIPACDVYFNGLLEQRARICDELAMLDRQARTDRAPSLLSYPPA